MQPVTGARHNVDAGSELVKKRLVTARPHVKGTGREPWQGSLKDIDYERLRMMSEQVLLALFREVSKTHAKCT